MKALAGLLCLLLLSACGGGAEPSQSGVCYIETRATERYVNCTDPTPDVLRAECSEVGSGVLGPCAQVLAGSTCVQIDVDSWLCLSDPSQQ